MPDRRDYEQVKITVHFICVDATVSVDAANTSIFDGVTVFYSVFRWVLIFTRLTYARRKGATS
jgi:hypothetical protein